MNDNKSTVMNNAAVQQLRKVPGFDPMKLLRKTISVKTGHPVWKLDLRYKRLWFRLACPNGRMLLKPLRISDQLAIIEAQVYFSKDDPVPPNSAGRISLAGNFSVPHKRMRSTWRWKTPVSASSSAT